MIAPAMKSLSKDSYTISSPPGLESLNFLVLVSLYNHVYIIDHV